MDVSIAFVLGALASLLASAIFWTLFRGVSPRLVFDKQIQCVTDGAGRTRYRIVMRNLSRRRSVLEPNVLATFRTSMSDAKLRSVWNIPVSNSNILRIRPGGNRVLTLDLPGMSNFTKQQMPSDVILAIESERAGSLEEVFSLGSRSTLTMEVIGQDSLSGTRKYLTSRDFTDDDLPSPPLADAGGPPVAETTPGSDEPV